MQRHPTSAKTSKCSLEVALENAKKKVAVIKKIIEDEELKIQAIASNMHTKALKMKAVGKKLDKAKIELSELNRDYIDSIILERKVVEEGKADWSTLSRMRQKTKAILDEKEKRNEFSTDTMAFVKREEQELNEFKSKYFKAKNNLKKFDSQLEKAERELMKLAIS